MEYNKFKTGGKFLTTESNVKFDAKKGALYHNFVDNTTEAKVESTRTLLKTEQEDGKPCSSISI